MQQGFVKLPREIINWRWFYDANILKLYIYLLASAAFKNTEWGKETLKAGQIITGRKKLAEALEISESQVRTALEKLESTGDISIKSTNKYSVITLLNWDKTQGDNYFFANKSPTNHQQVANKSPQYKKEYNVNNVKNNYAPTRKKENDYIIDSIDWSKMDEIFNM